MQAPTPENCFYMSSSTMCIPYRLWPHQTLWGAAYADNIKRASFPEILQDDEALYNFLTELEEYGLLVLHDIPRKRGQIEILSEHVGFLKRTHYGNTFSVEQKIDANNLAYTFSTLNLHVDFPYITYVPGVQVLHCISQTTGEGGDNLLVDAFNAAYQLQKLHPHKFEVLTRVPVDFKDKGYEPKVNYEFHTRNQEPVIK
ncbi:Gamma-butyrobetaine dioxygenase [Halocaridina rubra]|uniref:Gamma-butyrobetaine dioxygenase n=1 Tax=Halocaridina rubra TaxID=373956 RepID=A0AAN8ZV94_HALRR